MEKKRIGIIGGGISGAALGYYLSLYEEADITILRKTALAAEPPQSLRARCASLTTP